MPMRARSAAPPHRRSCVAVAHTARPMASAACRGWPAAWTCRRRWARAARRCRRREQVEGHLRQRLAAAEVTREGGDREALEVHAHAASPLAAPGRLVERRHAPARARSRAPAGARASSGFGFPPRRRSSMATSSRIRRARSSSQHRRAPAVAPARRRPEARQHDEPGERRPRASGGVMSWAGMFEIPPRAHRPRPGGRRC